MSDSGESVAQDAFFVPYLSVSGESDIQYDEKRACVSVSAESDIRGEAEYANFRNCPPSPFRSPVSSTYPAKTQAAFLR